MFIRIKYKSSRVYKNDQLLNKPIYRKIIHRNAGGVQINRSTVNQFQFPQVFFHHILQDQQAELNSMDYHELYVTVGELIRAHIRGVSRSASLYIVIRKL